MKKVTKIIVGGARFWFENDLKHREYDLPAVIFANGKWEYFKHNLFIKNNREEKMEEVKVKKTRKKVMNKLTVAELKRRLGPGTKLRMVEFCGEEVNKARVVFSVSTTYAQFKGDGIKDNETSYMNWPKATELTGTEDGFIIDTKFSRLRYKWEE